MKSEPRFEWRGVMLDVARHFFGVEDVKRFVGLIARFGFNRFHLHLTDDQGWRLAIESRPRLAELGEHYTQDEFADLVAFAAGLGVVVVPEIDMPGHVNAALVAYPELAPAGFVAEPYSGMEVGFSSFDVEREATYAFVDDVVREVAALTPGAWIHIGGDEAAATPREAYVEFVERACAIVRSHGKEPVGWEEIARARLEPGTIVQHWKDAELARDAVRQGARILMSPATRTYLDQKYDETTRLGLEWAGHVSLRDAYEWDPAELVEGVAEEDVLGVEAALWSETLLTMRDVEFMAFPRLLAIAEAASSPRGARDWDSFRARSAQQLAALDGLGVNYFRGA